MKEIAHLLAVHPNYLGDVVKKETGKSVSDWIDSRLVAEAKSLRLQTDLTIAQIACTLAFNEPTNFTKYFRHQTGLTPRAYRTDQPL
ncbi:helix-turn-helix domain-containing protein [Spirosoma jeollabukense]